MQSFQFRNDVTPPGDATIDVGVRPIALATFLNLDLEYQINKVNAPARQELEFPTELSAAQILLAECAGQKPPELVSRTAVKKTPPCWPRGPD
ncbi:hypothetical protein FJN17_08075 [Bradyrhizobium symbiodeficiens]|uniref:Uncharacterized protein n=1 Tax=Bradyrhizobium symbiodeficiens TaxID=1404367 RepID=A0ABX5W2U1_9BRAD|nr:hypothetical protein [Bradyrhizobium symbiodeficiens]QDF37526.1 hypothetical protein FJN17_08075 [Bradyrhizobium symbiodeficiens]